MLLLANGLSTFPFKGNPVFDNGSKSLPKNPPDCPNYCDEVLVKFILADQPFSKALQSLETCVLVNNNLNGKLFSSLEAQATIDESFKVTSERFFIPNFNL